MEETGANQSVVRASAVLSALGGGTPLRVAEVAKRAGLNQSTASRLLSTLESVDLVQRDDGGLYQLGPALITLGGVAVNQHRVHRAARQRAQSLAADLGLGANVAVRRGSSLFYLCNFEGRLAPRSFTLTGQYNPLHATGLGKSLLSGLTADERRQLVTELPSFTGSTVTDHKALDEAIEHIRSHGYCTEVEELALGRACIAAPIYDQAGAVGAAISVSGPLSALNLSSRERELADVLIETADAISTDLGYLGPAHSSTATRPAVQVPTR